jgi:hypothetical protein
MPVTIDELVLAATPELWTELGFRVDGDVCDVGTVRFRLDPAAGRGVAAWSLRDVDTTELDGLATSISATKPRAPAEPHPNGVTGVDHVVVFSPDLDRTVGVLEGAGFDLRRIREEPTPAGAPRQAFFRLGPTILELVQEPPDAVERGGGADRPAFFWGLAFVSPDLDATVAGLGEKVSEIRPAVQPGHRIASLRRSAGLSVPVAIMSPKAS